MAKWHIADEVTNWCGKNQAYLPMNHKDLIIKEKIIDLDNVDYINSIHNEFNEQYDGCPINMVVMKDKTVFYAVWTINEWMKILKGEK